MYLSKSTVVGITGGNSGLGLAIVKLLADICGTIKVIDRSDICDDLKQYKNVEYIKCDLSIEKPEPFEADLFIYNVGMSIGSKRIEEISHEEIEQMINVNINSHLWCFKNLKIEKHVFIDSVMAFMGFQNYSIYSACKAFIKSFNESLQAGGYDTMIVYPYKINTQMFTELKDFFPLRVEYVAEEIVRGIEYDKKDIILPRYFRYIINTLEYCPALIRKHVANLTTYLFLEDKQVENGEHYSENAQDPSFNDFVKKDLQKVNSVSSVDSMESSDSHFECLPKTTEHLPSNLESESKLRSRKVGHVINPNFD